MSHDRWALAGGNGSFFPPESPHPQHQLSRKAGQTAGAGPHRPLPPPRAWARCPPNSLVAGGHGTHKQAGKASGRNLDAQMEPFVFWNDCLKLFMSVAELLFCAPGTCLRWRKKFPHGWAGRAQWAVLMTAWPEAGWSSPHREDFGDTHHSPLEHLKNDRVLTAYWVRLLAHHIAYMLY